MIKEQNLRWAEMTKNCRFCWILPIRSQINRPSQTSYLTILTPVPDILASLLFLKYAKHSPFSWLWPFCFLCVGCSSLRHLQTLLPPVMVVSALLRQLFFLITSLKTPGPFTLSPSLLYFNTGHLSFCTGSSLPEFFPTLKEQKIPI